MKSKSEIDYDQSENVFITKDSKDVKDSEEIQAKLKEMVINDLIL